jgi:hypothetical protein
MTPIYTLGQRIRFEATTWRVDSVRGIPGATQDSGASHNDVCEWGTTKSPAKPLSDLSPLMPASAGADDLVRRLLRR